MSDEIDYNFLALRTVGWVFLLLIFITISFLGSSELEKKAPMMLFGFISCLVLIVLPYIVNTDLILGRLDDDEEYDSDDMIYISLKRTLPNTIITLIYFGFFVNAIKTKMKSNKTSTPTTSTASHQAGHFEKLAYQLSPTIITTSVYMAILIVLINVFSTLYIYVRCEDKNSDFIMRSLIMSQFNIIIITIIGVITYIINKP